ncbi:MAG: hypothetical protein KOO63_02675 [Bacteroidales bacterium]|nr:hypothetical protein [Candidatus Latescibacterota bacterium]
MRAIFEIFWGPPGLIFLGAIFGIIGALWSAHQQTGFEKALRIKSDEIAELNRTTFNAVTGGSSFCYFQIQFDGLSGRFVFCHEGDNTLFDVTARIVNLDRFEQLKGNFTFESFQHTDTIMPLGTMISGHALFRGEIPVNQLPKRGYNVFFTARNGAFSQLIRFAKTREGWAAAIKVTRDGRELFEKVDDDYPLGEGGTVDW